MQEPLGKSQPTVSHHTKALAEAGLIVGEKRGKWMWWRVVPDRLRAVRAALDPARHAAASLPAFSPEPDAVGGSTWKTDRCEPIAWPSRIISS